MKVKEFAEQIKQHIIEIHKHVGPQSPYIEGVGYRMSFEFYIKDGFIFLANLQLTAAGER